MINIVQSGILNSQEGIAIFYGGALVVVIALGMVTVVMSTIHTKRVERKERLDD